ncbi:hypothetical protein A3H38_01375 [candidate division WOR-1 bacterium RIFCSPLOWO2_02_FULL_46_20]|uniref:DUF2281 domain-containing protein n=2 Tax=Saganbacteria TaxID=1703751 RepID=A0A1F4RD60_UNCSA|nr:MAG: hypothetical protein A3J44_02790 [candidate division WOR-1 bacterium RIFCSPHIGHO2_02_FULL_45_12]OGC06107.1 MAG: hypothetical protein A3H38_01375 [candidate division WOR-1 bacterium RIFCSPLOWO2_02_FULL_46_20]OGC09381.1 MAG: hypothetical protein A3F86_02810 [candidate division WOR-1 bacterium RIFCSPLOWO2_12_FULL_45_9]
MSAAVNLLKREIVDKIDGLPKADIRELRNFVVFLEMKNILPQIDTSQAYFWSKKWQKMEKEVDKDKKAGRVVGTGKARDLLKALKRAA